MVCSLIHYKEWDSNFFEKKIFDLDVKQSKSLSLAYLDSLCDEIIQAKISAKDTEKLDELQQLGFLIAETEMCFEKLLLEFECSNLNSKIELADLNDIVAVTSLASQAFAFSRFRSPWYKTDDSARFYSEWAKNAILARHDDLCLKMEDEQSRLVGFVTGKLLDKETTRIGLICTDKLVRGKKVGFNLLAAIENWSRVQGASKILVNTQGSNLRACNFYLQNGYRLREINYWLYR
ncbi:GNAT family N-acetyltransferase [Legionella brunensis]|uniref:dTDP-fucosamine acetyltransferase n=1 Tax=Legionella brunensis TaxID=29422 RepID=A0A0W0SDG5_9GAMM|nr:GNAT family N-acetyltransferase [Legionella brunensis]KTC81410.1 dTDP-fucosamine acetyltransferase [Legionella brunensis]